MDYNPQLLLTYDAERERSSISCNVAIHIDLYFHEFLATQDGTFIVELTSNDSSGNQLIQSSAE